MKNKTNASDHMCHYAIKFFSVAETECTQIMYVPNLKLHIRVIVQGMVASPQYPL